MPSVSARHIRIASPCSKDWDKMTGNDRVRYCPECRLNVYNFSAMTGAEVRTLVAAREGRLCARFYQRADGTMLTQDCSVGLSEALWRASRLAASALSALLTLGPALAAAQQQKQDSPLVQIKPTPDPAILKVVDPVGALIPRADVTLTNQSTGSVIYGQTDEVGEFRQAGPAGNYKISVRAFGFKTFEISDVVLPVKTVIPIKLEVWSSYIADISPTPVPLSEAPIPSTLTEPTGTVFAGEVTTIDHRNPIRKFFSRLRRIF